MSNSQVVQKNSVVTNSNMALIDQFLKFLQFEKGLSKNTILAYRNDLIQYLSFIEKRGLNINNVTSNDISDFLWELKNNNLKSSSIYRKTSCIVQFHKFLIVEDVTHNDPIELLTRPKLYHKLPTVLTVEEVDKLLNFIPQKKVNDIRNKAMLELMYAAGLRVSEVINLKLEDLNLESRFIRIKGKGGKERIVPIGEKCVQAIKEWLNLRNKKFAKKLSLENRNYVFISKLARPISRVEFWSQMKNYVRQVGIQKNVSPHTLRHSFATHMLKYGADLRIVQELLGHSDISTTQIYTQVDRQQLKSVHKKYHPRG